MKSTLMKKVRWSAWTLATASAVFLTACGGGTEKETFIPTRMVVYGDESSLLDDSANPGNGIKYTINSVISSTDATIACAGNSLWVQVLANAYGLVFAGCNATAAPVTAIMHAALGAKVADLPAQTALETGYSGKDLVTVMVGANDVLAQYARYPGVSEDQLAAELEVSGANLAAQVNAIAAAGGKVVISTVLDMGLTPFALAEKAANTDTDRAALLTRLTARFNARLRANLTNDGRYIGLLLTDELVQTLVKFPSTYGYANVTSEACLSTMPLPTCTTYTLQPATDTVAAAGPNGWLWADATRLSPGGHNSLGNLAASRAANNPF
jgi:outer membrane lipase/esterase